MSKVLKFSVGGSILWDYVQTLHDAEYHHVN